MHEAQLVRSLIGTLRKMSKEKGATAVRSIKVRLGGTHWLDPEAFQCLFEQLSIGTICQGADLTITEQPPRAVCLSCSFGFLPLDHDVRCPKCRSSDIEIEAAPDLEILEVQFVIPQLSQPTEKPLP
ncbi:MAG: hydrogenase/urease maturation nickel metallochaperone HypA [Armatimonadetes bacterium]|nr:hydrogenase/urease maturation nickel metallochaperone HypA [Armatimonadota bacterium]MDW8122397.1 hydrogenase maturation nickel metallochaperone HypA [Armatimonadota bacterium]